MAATREGGIEKGRETIAGGRFTDDPATEDENIGVVVLARETRRRHVVAEGRTDVTMAIGSDGDAYAGPTDQHAALCATLGQSLCDGVCLIRVVRRLGGVGTEIEHVQAALDQNLLELFLQGIPGVVSGKGDRLGQWRYPQASAARNDSPDVDPGPGSPLPVAGSETRVR